MPFSGGFAATGDATISYSASGLPPGLTLNSSTGAITGTPTTAGTYSVSIGAHNSCGNDYDSLTITIDAAPPVDCPGVPTLVCDSIAASKTKCGYEEYAPHISSPPKLYRTRTWAGQLRQQDFAGPDCSGPVIGEYQIDFSGSCTWSIPGCVEPTSGCNYTESTGGGPVQECVQPMGNFTAFCADDPCLTNVISGTRVCWTGDGNCRSGHPAYWVLPNGACEELSDEYTTGDLIWYTTGALPSYPGTWAGDCLALRDLAADEMSYSIQRFRYKLQLPSMVGITTAHIAWVERFTPAGGGAPIDTPKSYDWDGSSTETGEYYVSEPVTNGMIEVVDIVMTCT